MAEKKELKLRPSMSEVRRIGYTNPAKLAEEYGELKRAYEALLKSDHEFIKGYACACATLANGWGMPDLAQMVLREGGFDKDDLKRAEVEESDVAEIFKDGAGG